MKKRDIIIVTICIATALICISLTFWGNYKNDGVLSPDAFYSVLATFIGICATFIVGFQIASFVKIHETERQIKEVQKERDNMLKEKESFLEEMNQIRIELSNICLILSETIPDNGKPSNIRAKIFTQILSIMCMVLEKDDSSTTLIMKYEKLKASLEGYQNRKILYPPICVYKLKKLRIPDNIEHYTKIMKLHLEIIEMLDNAAEAQEK